MDGVSPWLAAGGPVLAGMRLIDRLTGEGSRVVKATAHGIQHLEWERGHGRRTFAMADAIRLLDVDDTDGPTIGAMLAEVQATYPYLIVWVERALDANCNDRGGYALSWIPNPGAALPATFALPPMHMRPSVVELLAAAWKARP